MSKEAMTLALEVLKNTRECDAVSYAIKALEEALTKQEQGEPVAWMTETGSVWKTREKNTDIPLYTTPQPAQQGEPVGEAHLMQEGFTHCIWSEAVVPVGTKFYTTPQPAQKPLTDEAIATVYWGATGQSLRPQDNVLAHKFARAIEAAHGIKENT